ncbi:hypothetical protein [Flavobacterium piscisymbiosum]|uniref:Uncharacterized protein n=1 Tax=Flavobacterium piscisymbiosum TaxID=2893753 RepID=A0ABS8MDR9_9FLAO|nr:hypothetical protein [Flavobacterium sp. F-30]MCC9063642.1 hypothetical protein [Flavobacterium sp. F-30]
MEKLKLKNTALVVLFLTSYLPLFGLLVLRQIKQNRDFLNFKGLSKDAITVFFSKFGLSIFLISISIYGLFGLYLLMKNLKRKINNGEIVKILEVENKNSEAIGYISTYIVPFIFQDTNDVFDLISIILVLIIIFLIYIKSNMIAINPILNINHSLFQIEYSVNGKKRKGLLITELDEIDENQELKINQISKNIFYG